MQSSSNKRPYNGLFITIEGGDGCGKSSLSNLLTLELEKRGHSVLKTREPGGTALSEQIRQILLTPKADYQICSKAELLLFLAARAQHLEERILPALLKGQVVICERFNDSSIAYQGCARHLGMRTVEAICKLVCDDPDVTLFLDLDPEEGIRRIKKERQSDRLEQEKLQFHKEVRQGYLHLADENPERIAILDAAEPIETVLAQALRVLEPHFQHHAT